MSQSSSMSGGSAGLSQPVLRKIGTEDVVKALRQGLKDFRERPSHYFFLCLVYPVMGIVIGVWTSGNNALPVLFPLLAGFALVGPIAALGLYEISRRRERGLDSSWTHAFEVLKSPSLFSIAGLSLLLLIIFFVWLASAQGLYQFVYGDEIQQSFAQFASDVLTTSRGWTLIVLGNAVGLLFAVVVLSISVVSFPLLLDRPVGILTALQTSVRASVLNAGPILLWGLIVALSLLLGALTLFVGLAVALPILGHATWHLYRRLVQPAGQAIGAGRATG